MTNPIISHTINRAQFVQPKPKIIAVQTTIPTVAVKGTAGVLNCRWSSGFFTRIIHTPAHTSINAKSVPILVISPTTSAGINPANNAESTKNIAFDLYGVLYLGCTSEKTFGTNPSRLIVKKTRDCP